MPFDTPEPQPPCYVTFDYAIKYILRDKANFGILEGLLTCILGRKVTIKELLESESNPDGSNDKHNRVDLLCGLEPPVREAFPIIAGRPRTEKAPYEDQPELVYIEFQFNRLLNFFHRMAYGASKLLVQNLSKGDDYEKVRKVYCISVLTFSLGEGEDYAYRGRTDFIGIRKHDRLQLSANAQKLYGKRESGDIFPEFFLFRLKNLPDLLPTDHLEEWLYFMKHSKLPANHSAPGLQEAMERFDYFQLSEAERRLYDRYQEMDRDTRSLETTREYELQIAQEEKEAALVAKSIAQEENAAALAAKSIAQEEKEAALAAKSIIEQNLHIEQHRAETEQKRAEAAEREREQLLAELRAAQEQLRRIQSSES